MDEAEQDFTRNILRQVRQIEIRSNRLVSEALAGSYHSAFKGQGIDFEEVREYQPGDEVRSIDWNVTAKMGLPFVKQFREERELTILLAIDISESGSFGSSDRSKRERIGCPCRKSSIPRYRSCDYNGRDRRLHQSHSR